MTLADNFSSIRLQRKKFLDLNDNDNLPAKLTYFKDGI